MRGIVADDLKMPEDGVVGEIDSVANTGEKAHHKNILLEPCVSCIGYHNCDAGVRMRS
jgi:hypothetical protein